MVKVYMLTTVDDRLCECGCGLRLADYMKGRKPSYISKRQFIGGHQNRGRPRRRRREGLFDSSYFDVVDCGYDTPCWLWRGSISHKGYGRAWSAISKRYMTAHHAVWEERLGPFPEGLQADHLCRVRSCVNPNHIEPVTASENMRRSSVAKLSPADHQLLVELAKSGWPIRAMARHFGVTPDTIRRRLKIGGRHGQVPNASS